MEYILVTDIGGTHARFFLLELNKSNLTQQKILKEKHYRTTEYNSIDEILDLYLQEFECQNHKPNYCSIAIAGNVIQNKIDQFANFEWNEIDGNKLAIKYGFQQCILMNDFEAVGYFAFSMDFDNFHTIYQSKNKVIDKTVIMGIGTGIGVVFINDHHNKNSNFKVFPCEGGHLPIPILDEDDFNFLEYIKQIRNLPYHCYTSHEFVIGGTGIPYLYRYLCESNKVECPDNLTGLDVFNLLNKENPMTEIFFEHYMKYLGRVLECLIKIFLTTGGNILLGGIVYKLFQKHFNLKTDLFYKKLKKHIYTDKVFNSTYKLVNIYIFSEDISQFGIQGAFNRILLQTNETELTDQTIQNQYTQKFIQNLPDDIQHKKVNVKLVTFKGALNKNFKNQQNSDFLVKIKSLPKVVELSIDYVKRSFKMYLVESLESKLKVITSMDDDNFYPNDILKIYPSNKIYFDELDQWYIHVNYDNLQNISSDFFDEVSYQITKDQEKVDGILIGQNLQKYFKPKKLERKNKELTIDTLLKVNKNSNKIQTKKTYFQVMNIQGKKYYRTQDNKKAEEYQVVLLKSNSTVFKALIPIWSPIPKQTFYGYLILEMLFAPGFKKFYFLVLTENQIEEKSQDFDKYIQNSSNVCDIEEFAKQKFPNLF